jgi:microsomal epoxide hydrolase
VTICLGRGRAFFNREGVRCLLYWVPNTFSSAIRIYYESNYHPWTVQPGNKVKVPTGVAAFPKDIVPILKSQAEKYFNVVRFTEYPRGGHFAIHEQAEVMARDIREFFRPLRKKHHP